MCETYLVHYEELLDLYSIHSRTTGEDIFKRIENGVQKNKLKRKRCLEKIQVSLLSYQKDGGSV